MNEENQTAPAVIEKGDEQFQAIASFNTTLEPAAVKKTMAAAGAKSADLWQVPVGKLRPLPNFNMRLDSERSKAHIDRLFKSIMANGFYKDKPLTGFVAVDPDNAEENIIYYTDGHHRMEAVELAIKNGKNIDVLPIMIKDKETTINALTISSFHSNNLQEPYTPLETSLLCLRLRQSVPPMETFQIAEALNLTKAYVETLLILARSPKEIRDMVQAGKVSASQAIDLLKKRKDEAQAILEKAVAVKEAAEKKAKEAAEAKAKAAEEAKRKADAAKTSPELTEALERLGPASGPAKETTPVTGTTTATKPASQVEAEKVKPVRVTKADLNPMAKLEAEQLRLAPRLFAEILRMEKAGEIKNMSAELEKILFTIEAATPKAEA